MKQPTLIEGMVVALAVSVAGATCFSVFTVIFAQGITLKVILALMSLGYIIYLLFRSQEKVGRITVTTLWLITAILAYLFAPSIGLYVLVHLGLIWLIRSLYYYQGILPALMDLGLTAMSLIAAIWAWSVSQSLLLGFWCFFLSQSLWVLNPKQLTGHSTPMRSSVPEDRFERAYRTAETAVRKLTSIY